MVTWQLGVWDSPYNKGLIPKKMLFYDLVHYYQVGREGPPTVGEGQAGTKHQEQGAAHGWMGDSWEQPPCDWQ